MTIKELKDTISQMPDDAIVQADEFDIDKVVAILDTQGNISSVNIEIM